MIYNAIITETREFVYAVQVDSLSDAFNKFIALDPKQTTPSYASILEGPTQVDIALSNLCEASHGLYITTEATPQLITGTPTYPNPFGSSYTATIREIRFSTYWINCDPSVLDSIIVQLNPSISTLPAGVTLSMGLQQSTVRPVVMFDENGGEITPWV